MVKRKSSKRKAVVKEETIDTDDDEPRRKIKKEVGEEALDTDGDEQQKKKDGPPRIILGTYKIKKAVVIKKMIKAAIDNNYGGIDTAAIYDNETEIGAALKSLKVSRDSLYLQSKLWRSVPPSDVEKKLKKSIKDLGVTHLDCYIMHWPGPARHLNYAPVTKTSTTIVSGAIVSTKKPNKNPKKVVQCPSDWTTKTRHDSWEQLSLCVDKGLTRHLGVSNFSFKQLRDLIAFCKSKNLHLPTLVQNEFHPLLKMDPRVTILCNENNITFQAHSSLGCGHELVLDNSVVKDIAARNNISPAVVLFKYGLAKNCTLIIKSTNVDRLESNITGINDTSTDLTADEVDALTEVSSNVTLINYNLGPTANEYNTCLLSWLKEYDPSHYDHPTP